MPETVKRTARVPILGENGRISDDYIPAAIGENVEKAETAATGAEAAKTGADKAKTSAETAQKGAEAAKTSAETAQKGAEAAKTGAETAKTAAEKAKADAESAGTAASNSATQAAGSAQDAQQSATAAAESAASVADKYISSAQATTLEPGSQATASVEDQVLTIGVPKGDKGDKGDPGQDGANGTDGVTPFTQAAVTTLEPGAPATVTIEDNTLKLGIPKGETGDKGDPGTAATIAVGSVTGLDAGTSPTVVNSGTTNAARFDFGIPKGDKGDTGDPGHTPQRGVDYWTAEDVEAVVEDAKAQAVAELAEIGNVPKRTVTDLVAHGEDAYAQKPIEVRVKGRTVKNLWPAINNTAWGVTGSTDSSGLISFSGTATNYAPVGNETVSIKPGVTYTAASSALKSGATLVINAQTNEGSYVKTELEMSIASSGSKTFTVTSSGADRYVAYVAFNNGISADGFSTRVMLVEGTEVPDCFTPPASITSVQAGNLVTAGKNLVNLDGAEYVKSSSSSSSSSSSATFGDDGSVTIIGETDSWNGCYVELKSVELPPGSYVASGFTNKDIWLLLTSQNVLFPSTSGNYYTERGYPFMVDTSLRQAFKIDMPSRVAFSVGDRIAEGVSLTLYPQLELGSTPTTYEPPHITTTPLPEVELRSLPNGTCDELVIKADGTCEVERRTQLVDGEVVALDTPTTEPQSPVTLPALPAPTFNQYHDSDVPSDTSATYTRDINITLANLEAQIADLVTKEAANV